MRDRAGAPWRGEPVRVRVCGGVSGLEGGRAFDLGLVDGWVWTSRNACPTEAHMGSHADVGFGVDR